MARMQKPGFESDLWHLYCMSSPQFPVHLYLLSSKKCENPKKIIFKKQHIRETGGEE